MTSYVDPVPGQLFQHTKTKTVAVFVGWRAGFTGAPLMVLRHPKWGECRWSPERAEPYHRPRLGPKPKVKPRGTR